MDDNLDDLDPGAYADATAGDGQLPDDSSLSNLTSNFTPSLENLLPAASASTSPAVAGALNMDDDTSIWSDLGLTDTQGTGLLNSLESSGSSLLSAFVTTPQNVSTAEGAALTTAQISSALSSQWFGYALIALVIYLVFTVVEK